MTKFSVWAPFANSVGLKLNNVQIPMHAGERGWWHIDAPQAAHGTRYQYILNDGEPLPDPRSPWQPEGVNGASAVVDHALFNWMDANWEQPPLSESLIYELHTGTFSPEGTFDGIIGKLDYLKDLGVTHIELMPVAEAPGERGWGYDGVGLYAPHHAYGGPQGLKRLVDACHQKNLGVILDVVYNHLGPDGNYLGQFGPYFTDRYVTPWGEAVNLDGPGSDEVRCFFIDNALMWLRDYHFDGLRLDAIHTLIDTSAVHFLEELAEAVDQLESDVGRRLIVIAESDLNDPRIVRSREFGGCGIDCQWNDDFHHALHAVLTGEQASFLSSFGLLGHLAKALEHTFVYDGNYSPFRQRRFGRKANDLSRDHFIAFLQNHDQIGNRPAGERINQMINENLHKVGAALVLISPFVPMLFQGEEWAASTPFLFFTDHQDPQLATAVSDGRRREFIHLGWAPDQVPDPQARETFERSCLDWSEVNKEPHARMLDWYRRLIKVRRERLTAAGNPEPVVQYNEDQRWLVMQRGQVVVACNFSDQTQDVLLPERADREVLLASPADNKVEDHTLKMLPQSVIILT